MSFFSILNFSIYNLKQRATDRRAKGDSFDSIEKRMMMIIISNIICMLEAPFVSQKYIKFNTGFMARMIYLLVSSSTLMI